MKDTSAPYYAGGPAVLPDTLPGNVADFHNFSWREYGQRVGLFRMVDAFDEVGVPAGCTMNAKTALERRAMVEVALERGWQIVAHNFEQGDLLTNYAQEPERERALIRRVLDIYRDVCGRPARGWLSSSLRGTANTPEILAQEGLSFFATT